MPALVSEDAPKLVCGYHLTVLRPFDVVLGQYLYFALASRVSRYQFAQAANGVTRFGLGQQGIKNVENLHFPSIKEQQNIVEFLEHKTSQIDALIEKKRALIEKLNEKRTAVITQAATKGLDPDVPMKDSGIEWLGEVPEHWEVISIKQLCQVKRGASPRPIDNPIFFDDEGEYAWVRIADVTASYRYLTETTQRLSELGKSLSVPLKKGDLFLSIAGSVGKPMITQIKCCIHDGFVYFPNYAGSYDYLYHIFASGQPFLGLGKLGTQLNLNTDTVGGIKIGLPDKSEQQKIVRYLEEEVTKGDSMIMKTEETIATLQKYRTALITSAVTGQIDVRDFGVDGCGAVIGS